MIKWFLGIIVKIGLGELLKKLSEKTLSKKLLKVVKKWATNLPKDLYIDPEAIWVDPFNKIEHIDNSPHQENLQKIIEANETPSEENWFEAFMEKWKNVKTSLESPQSFFLLEENLATTYIRDLAHKIYNEFTQDPIKARRAIIDALYKKELLNKIELEKNLYKNTRQQIEKQKNCRKYIPDIYCELDQVKENTRYFVAPLTFWPNVIEQINRLNLQFLNSLFNQVGLDKFKIGIPENLKTISKVKEIESKGVQVVQLLNERIDYLKRLDESRKYYHTYTGWMLEGAIHKVIWAIEDILKLINCTCTKVFCFTSTAGQGKTNFVCDLVENVLNKRSLPCLYFNARDFNSTSLDRIDEYIAKTVSYDLGCKDLIVLLKSIGVICAEKNTTLTIIIDGLNEHAETIKFSSTLEKLIERLLSFNFIKIILTCRTEYFEQRFGNLKTASFKERTLFYENINVKMHEIKKRRLIDGYFKFFNISYSSMSTSVKQRLSSDPLLLRIFCEAYGDPKASTTIRLPAVYHMYKEELFNTYYEKKLTEIKDKDLSSNGLVIGYEAKYKQFLRDIIAKMVESKVYENIPVTEISSNYSDILGKLLDEDIIVRKDLLPQDSILSPDSEVINFTFDEFRDYLIALYLVDNVFSKDPSIFESLLTDLITPDSPIAEGVSRFIFCISKRKNNAELNQLIKNVSWYDDVFLDGIFSVRDNLVDGADIDIICKKFKYGIYESSFITYSLIQRFDTEAFINLNTNLLINILIGLNETDYEKYIIPVFEGERDHYYGRPKEYITIDYDKLIRQLSEKFNNEDLTEETRFLSLYEMLIYLFPIKNYPYENTSYNLYNKFALMYPNDAKEQLIRAVETKNVFTEYLVWKNIVNLCENNIEFPDSFTKCTLNNIMKAQYDIHDRHTALSNILRGDSTEARIIYFLNYISRKNPEFLSSDEKAYIKRHYDYFFPNQRYFQ